MVQPTKMWLGKSVDVESGCTTAEAAKEEALFQELHKEVRGAAPSAHLPYALRCRLERFNGASRNRICSMIRDGCSPLFVACKKGNVEIVEYLISVCGADVEQRGQYEVPDDHSVHNVTPLWCAAVAGKLKVVDTLVRHGADVNSVSDTGSTPVRSACFMTHLDIVRLLVAHNADIQRPNYNGGTCLINSVQSVELCEFLLVHGADVNAQDIQSKTALHYAIQEHRFETTRLLLQYGADPFLVSRYGDDALQTACLKGATEIFAFLVGEGENAGPAFAACFGKPPTSGVRYSPERVASGYELLGATFLDEHHDSHKTLRYWRKALDVRERHGLVKAPKARHASSSPSSSSSTCDDSGLSVHHYGGAREFSDRAELEAASLDLDATRMQSLLICERVLGTAHKDTIYRLMYRGAAYADSMQYQRCIDLWRYALELRVRKDSILFCDTCFTAQALVKLYVDLFQKQQQQVRGT